MWQTDMLMMLMTTTMMMLLQRQTKMLLPHAADVCSRALLWTLT